MFQRQRETGIRRILGAFPDEKIRNSGGRSACAAALDIGVVECRGK
jgi:hypothetical protein